MATTPSKPTLELTMSDMLGVALRDARGPLNTLMERLAGLEGPMWLRRLNLFNREENPFEVPRIFYVTTLGISGEDWIPRLENAHYNFGYHVKQFHRDKKFIATNGVMYKLIVIKGDEFEDEKRITSNIREEARRRGYATPTAEMAPYLREAISDGDLKAMGLKLLVVMHEPIEDSRDNMRLLGLDRGVKAPTGQLERQGRSMQESQGLARRSAGSRSRCSAKARAPR